MNFSKRGFFGAGTRSCGHNCAMFFSADFLSRATSELGILWIAGTMGDGRRMNRSLSKRDMLRVNLKEACQSVLAPMAPFTLRTSSNLLAGAARLFGHQCDQLHRPFPEFIFENTDVYRRYVFTFRRIEAS